MGQKNKDRGSLRTATSKDQQRALTTSAEQGPEAQIPTCQVGIPAAHACALLPQYQPSEWLPLPTTSRLSQLPRQTLRKLLSLPLSFRSL